MSEKEEVGVSLDAQRAVIRERIDTLEAQVKVKLNARKQFARKKEEEPLALAEELGELLERQASQVNLLNNLSRESMVLLYENKERDARARAIRETPEGHVASVPEAPDDLATKSREEIIHVLRSKQKCTWQEIVDYMVAHGIKTAKGGKWTTSTISQMHKKGFRTTG